MMNVNLLPLDESDRDQFILDTQEAFNYGAMEEFGRRDDHFEEDEQIISRETIENSIDNGEAYRIVADGMTVGGVIIRVEGAKEMILVEEVDNKEFLRELARAILFKGEVHSDILRILFTISELIRSGMTIRLKLISG